MPSRMSACSTRRVRALVQAVVPGGARRRIFSGDLYPANGRCPKSAPITSSPSPSGWPRHWRAPRSSHSRGLDLEVRAAEEDPGPVLPWPHRLSGQPPPRRAGRGRLGQSTRVTTSVGSSAPEQRDSGTSLPPGSVHANALTCATATGVTRRARPARGKSTSAARSAATNRLRHLPAVSTSTPTSAAIASLAAPAAADNPIRARTTPGTRCVRLEHERSARLGLGPLHGSAGRGLPGAPPPGCLKEPSFDREEWRS